MLPTAPSAADTDHYFYTYVCELDGRLTSKDKPRTIGVEVSIPRIVQVGQSLALAWTLSDSHLVSPTNFASGGKVSITATVKVAGLLQGKLDSLGDKTQDVLVAGNELVLPTAIPGAAAVSKEGKVTVTPADLVIDFTPPASTVRINDTDGTIIKAEAGDEVLVDAKKEPIRYKGSWEYMDNTNPDRSGDSGQDVTWTAKADDLVRVWFTGTQLKYITERNLDMGLVKARVDNAGEWEQRDASLDEDNQNKVQGRKYQKVLWASRVLPYGEHEATIKNVDGTHMLVDAFDVITDQLSSPPKYFQTRCKPQRQTNGVTVDVVAAPSNDGSNGGNNNENGEITDGDDSARGVIVLSGGGQGHGAPTATATATKTAKPTATSKASKTPQVRVTPKGGAHTGEAPANDTSSPLLIGYGTTLALGGVVGGLALRRRRAVHGSADRGNRG
ncbi:hypothetical protein AB0O34_21195 [Sphaerisporangium sp. NPDC088356]|uniref:hypothetical protein n=1 Tax=Sphaerisporangium sp. NPDC088356 TaxID=3154871 RepID=UPI003449FC72